MVITPVVARKLRIEFEGARYHVINRGNYRRDVFGSVGAAQAFEATLLEACAAYGWRLHAHVLMHNHYHLALETPQANLVQGMHWLQSTFATRFNRFRSERGHLFQGRYQALLIEDAVALGNVVDYIHLNPVRARLVAPEQLGGFRWSSLRKFLSGSAEAVYAPEDWLLPKGFDNDRAGWQAYVAWLQALATDEREQAERGFETMSKGWAVGTHAWKRQLAADYAQQSLAPGMEAGELRELREARWRDLLESGLKQADVTTDRLESSRRSAVWKMQIARELRMAGAPYAWIARELHMGAASSVRAYVAGVKTSN